MPRPISVNGIATTNVAPKAARSANGVMVAAVASHAITTTGISDTTVRTRPAKIRPANRGPGPTGKVRVYGSHGCDRSSATPMPYWKRFVVITAKVTIDAVAKVAATGS